MPWIHTLHSFYTYNKIYNMSIMNIKFHISVFGTGITK